MLIGGGHFLVEVVQGLVVLSMGEGEGAREGAGDVDFGGVGLAVDEHDGVAFPGYFAGLGGAFGGEANRRA